MFFIRTVSSVAPGSVLLFEPGAILFWRGGAQRVHPQIHTDSEAVDK